VAGLGVAGLAVAGALLWLLLNDADSQGPLIKGKPVAYWTRQFRPFPEDLDAISALAAEKSLAIPAQGIPQRPDLLQHCLEVSQRRRLSIPLNVGFWAC